jgi:predicted amidohydrolase
LRGIHRRNLLKAASGGLSLAIVSIAKAEQSTTVALLHLAPRPGAIEDNKRMVEDAVRRASAGGARFVVCPELVVSGYGFRDMIGTDWIASGQPALFAWAGELARQASAFLLLGTPEADGRLFNSQILFAPDGSTVGRHRKIMVLKVGSESWSTAGDRSTVVAVGGIGRIGLFVCADMYSRRLVDETAAQGVDLLVSSAAWAPGHHGPNGEWERASLETGRPVLVCNRTGADALDFREAQSVAAVGGTIASFHRSPDSAIVLLDWNSRTHQVSNWRVV